MPKTVKKIKPGRVAERRLTEGIASGKYKTKKSPDGRTIVFDPKKPKGKRVVGDLGPAR